MTLSSCPEKGASGLFGAMPQTPTTPRGVTRGWNWKRTLGKVPVRQPAAHLCRKPSARRHPRPHPADRARPGRMMLKLASSGPEAQRRMLPRLPDLQRRCPENFVVGFVGQRQLAGEVEQGLRALRPFPASPAHAAAGDCERSRDKRDDQRHHQRDQFVRGGDGEAVTRFDEKPVAGEKTT